MRMVKLTTWTDEEIFINPNRVAHVGTGKEYTRIYYSGLEDDYVCVQEPPQTVVNLLETGYKNRKPSRTCL